MEDVELERAENLSPEDKLAIIRSWFDKYEIVKIVVKRPDLVIWLK